MAKFNAVTYVLNCGDEKTNCRTNPGEVTMRLLWETWIVGIIATLDCLSTIYLLHTGKAVEANPLLARIVAWNLAAFFVVKMSMVIAPLWGLERIRRTPGKERFVRLVMRGGLIAYLVIYLGTMVLEFQFPGIARALHIIPN
jgi:hypothetical protein